MGAVVLPLEISLPQLPGIWLLEVQQLHLPLDIALDQKRKGKGEEEKKDKGIQRGERKTRIERRHANQGKNMNQRKNKEVTCQMFLRDYVRERLNNTYQIWQYGGH